MAAAFAAAFPDLPDEVFSLAATEVARVAVHLGVPGLLTGAAPVSRVCQVFG